MSNEVRRLNGSEKRFEAAGKNYIVHETLTVDGFQRLEELRVEMEAGNSVSDMLKLLNKAYDLTNKGRLADASVALYNAINVQERIVQGRPAAWLLALSLFVRPEGADLSRWTEQDAAQWIEDWNSEGLAIADLFNLAFTCNRRLGTDFSFNFPGTSDAPAKESGGEW